MTARCRSFIPQEDNDPMKPIHPWSTNAAQSPRPGARSCVCFFSNEMSSSSDYGRRAIFRQLREDGIDIAVIIPADSVKA